MWKKFQGKEVSGSAFTQSYSNPAFDSHGELIELMRMACPVCGKMFKARKNLRQHMETHGDMFQCKKCLIKFTFRSSLTRHNRTSCPFRNTIENMVNEAS
ncbi:uncharacterized protein LOC143228929 isoform X1 [Tachypleus tridentatus]|uniref:uncharacterized protein LOC143228929 isoform X1 n=1 Tax=Tachypleus tridentatus TaxID=6853 RepID=UPI003FD1AA2B